MTRTTGETLPKRVPAKTLRASSRVRQASLEEGQLEAHYERTLPPAWAPHALQYQWRQHGNSLTVHADCFEWLGSIPPNSLHAVITDPPYGVKEYDFDQIEKRTNGNGGIWRIPPSFDGHLRAPLPRFTALTEKERLTLSRFFTE